MQTRKTSINKRCKSWNATQSRVCVWRVVEYRWQGARVYVKIRTTCSHRQTQMNKLKFISIFCWNKSVFYTPRVSSRPLCASAVTFTPAHMYARVRVRGRRGRCMFICVILLESTCKKVLNHDINKQKRESKWRPSGNMWCSRLCCAFLSLRLGLSLFLCLSLCVGFCFLTIFQTTGRSSFWTL